jgi:hypothetical protein
MASMGRRLLAVALGAALGVVSRDAGASMPFPADIQSYLHLTCPNPPDCIICHQTEMGGLNTSTQPFSLALRQFGLMAGDIHSLETALDQDRITQSDVDHDGHTDIQALQDCQNPNIPYATAGADGGDSGISIIPGPPPDPIPQYGCQIARKPDPDASVAALAVGGALLALGRWRARAGRRRA